MLTVDQTEEASRAREEPAVDRAGEQREHTPGVLVNVNARRFKGK
jgi:hypothetical protein